MKGLKIFLWCVKPMRGLEIKTIWTSNQDQTKMKWKSENEDKMKSKSNQNQNIIKSKWKSKSRSNQIKIQSKSNQNSIGTKSTLNFKRISKANQHHLNIKSKAKKNQNLCVLLWTSVLFSFLLWCVRLIRGLTCKADEKTFVAYSLTKITLKIKSVSKQHQIKITSKRHWCQSKIKSTAKSNDVI